jgi:hypothetical protein
VFRFEAENDDHRALLSRGTTTRAAAPLPGGGGSSPRRRRRLLSPAAVPELDEDPIAFSFSFEGLDGYFVFFLGT